MHSSSRVCQLKVVVKLTMAFFASMFQRKSNPDVLSTALPEQDFENDIEDLVADNVISSQRGARILRKATKAGLKSLSKKTQNLKGANQARAMRRKKLKIANGQVHIFFSAGFLTGKQRQNIGQMLRACCHTKF